MNATKIINENMTLEAKLEAIDRAMANAQAQANEEAKAKGQPLVPIDPAEALSCEGCQ